MVRMRDESSVERIRMALTEKRDMLGAMIAAGTSFRTTVMYERFLDPAMLEVQSK